MTLNEKLIEPVVNGDAFLTAIDALNYTNRVLEEYGYKLDDSVLYDGEGFYQVLDEEGNPTPEYIYAVLEQNEDGYYNLNAILTNEEELNSLPDEE